MHRSHCLLKDHEERFASTCSQLLVEEIDSVGADTTSFARTEFMLAIFSAANVALKISGDNKNAKFLPFE